MLQVMGGGAEPVVAEPLSFLDVYSEMSGRKPAESVHAPAPPKKLNQL
jgi:hypothetical protein